MTWEALLPLASEARFASFLAYTPRPDTPAARRAKNFCLKIKQDGTVGGRRPARAIAYAVARLRADIASTPIGEFLGERAVLVPTPGSGMLVRGALWPARRLSDELVTQGLGLVVWTALRRARPVPKSALAAAEERPKAKRHYDSLQCHGTRPIALARAKRIVVVDDVITRGATMLAAISRVAEWVPDIEVVGFALLRTISRPEDFDEILSPMTGRIRRRAHETFREP